MPQLEDKMRIEMKAERFSIKENGEILMHGGSYTLRSYALPQSKTAINNMYIEDEVLPPEGPYEHNYHCKFKNIQRDEKGKYAVIYDFYVSSMSELELDELKTLARVFAAGKRQLATALAKA